jgi:hypothetical protein
METKFIFQEFGTEDINTLLPGLLCIYRLLAGIQPRRQQGLFTTFFGTCCTISVPFPTKCLVCHNVFDSYNIHVSHKGQVYILLSSPSG